MPPTTPAIAPHLLRFSSTAASHHHHHGPLPAATRLHQLPPRTVRTNSHDKPQTALPQPACTSPAYSFQQHPLLRTSFRRNWLHLLPPAPPFAAHQLRASRCTGPGRAPPSQTAGPLQHGQRFRIRRHSAAPLSAAPPCHRAAGCPRNASSWARMDGGTMPSTGHAQRVPR